MWVGGQFLQAPASPSSTLSFSSGMLVINKAKFWKKSQVRKEKKQVLLKKTEVESRWQETGIIITLSKTVINNGSKEVLCSRKTSSKVRRGEVLATALKAF